MHSPLVLAVPAAVPQPEKVNRRILPKFQSMSVEILSAPENFMARTTVYEQAG
jgi:hypothetical protein